MLELGLLVPVQRNCNALAYKDILHNCVLQTLCKFEEELHMTLMVSCS